LTGESVRFLLGGGGGSRWHDSSLSGLAYVRKSSNKEERFFMLSFAFHLKKKEDCIPIDMAGGVRIGAFMGVLL
jgi:hypothetical protein